MIQKFFVATKVTWLIGIILFFWGNISIAQSAKTPARPEGYWLGYFGDNKLTPKIGIHSELQLRNFLLPYTNQTMLTRIGLNYYIKPFAVATMGYGYIYNEPSNDDVIGSQTSENRIWQQLILRQKTKNIFIDHRYRLEQRFINNITNSTQQLDHRIRYRFQTLFPLYTLDPHLRHWFLAFNSEVMIHLKKDPSKLFDRNRFFAGIGYQVSPKMNFQLGYLNQLAQVSGNTKPHLDHIVMFSISYNMDDLMQTIYKKKAE